MIKFKQSSDKRQIMVIGNAGSCEFLNHITALKAVFSLIRGKVPFVVLSKNDRVMFSCGLRLSHLSRI